MAPGAKRKRNDRTYSQDSVNDGPNRPSPHRPQNLATAQANQHNQHNNARGGRRASRGRGGSNTLRSPSHSQQSTMPPPTTTSTTPSTARPPPTMPSSILKSPSADKQFEKSSRSEPPASNEYLTKDNVASWRGAGRKAVISRASEAQTEGDNLTLSVVFEELVRGCLDGVLDPADIGSAVQEILAVPHSASTLEPVSIFLDTISSLTESDASHPSLKPMLHATAIDPARLRAELETPLLTATGLVRPTFARVAIRKGTHALYRQSNYNLLREEPEGYSKLITEYFTTVNNEPPSDVVVLDTFQKVKALIGAFDLDVGRVLDVTLDVFANLLVRHYRFFIKLLRVSSWWPDQKIPSGIEFEEQAFTSLPRWAAPESATWYYTDEEKEEQLDLREARDVAFWQRVSEIGLKAYFELGTRRITGGLETLQDNEDAEPMNVDGADSTQKKKSEELPDTEKIRKWSREWMLQTGTLPPPGNRIAAQLLGFKLRFYASDARDAHDTLPENLMYLAVLLIKIGFISIVDLYPHLYPLDEDMPALRDKLMKEKKKEAKLKGTTGNALAMSGALPDDTHPSSVTRLREESKQPKSDSEKGTPGKTEDEKEKLPEPVDQKTSLLRSLLCIGALPEAFYILGRFPWLLDVYPDLHSYIHRLLHHSLSKMYQWARPFSKDDCEVQYKNATSDNVYSQANAGPSDFVPRKTLRWAKLEEIDAGDSHDYRFYWEDWADNVPVCQSVDDVFKLCKTLVNVIGAEFGKEPALLMKIARIGRKSLAEDASPSNTRRWIELTGSLLAPALSFTGRNPGVVNEMFDLMKHFDISTRYKIYAHWFTGAPSRKPAIAEKFVEVKKETTSVLKRISATNSRQMARELAKATYACPGVVFEHALRQIETYGNIGEVVVECSRYFTYLAYDCLTWSLINTLGREGRESVQADGMLISPWLRNASSFVGKVYKRYALMSPTPVLQYVTEHLYQGNSIMLAVLEQMVASMAGIGSDYLLTDNQIVGLCGGPSLKTFTLEHYVGDQRHLVKGSARRLMKCLVETGLASQILIAIAQEINTYPHRSKFSDTPPKVLAANLDNLHLVFAQFLDLLRSNLPPSDFDAIIPGLVSLITDFGIEPAISFMICRESITAAVNAVRQKAPDKSKAAAKNSQSQPMKDSNGDVVMGEIVMSPTTNGEKTEIEGDDAEMKDVMSSEASPSSGSSPSDPSAEPVLIPTFQSLADKLMASSPDVFGKHIRPVFYLTFWQLSFRDIHNPTAEYKKAQAHFSEKAMVVDNRRDVSVQAVKKRDADRQAAANQSQKFVEEELVYLRFLIRMRASLREEMANWFAGVSMTSPESNALHDALIQDCFLPRVLLSPEDAMFGAAMLKFMHSSGVPGFRTIKFLDLLMREKLLSNIIFACTSRESQNFGRFLADVLKELKGWHDSQENYVKYAHGVSPPLPGFGKTFDANRVPTAFLSYNEFRPLLQKWHSQLFKALTACLKSQDYMHIRNAINIMKAVAASFPAIDHMAKGLQADVQKLAEKEAREDLKLSAQSLLGDFKKSEKTWVTGNTFLGKAPRQASEEKALNAAAPDFTPKTTTNGVSKPKTSGSTGNEHEDGEVQDDKKQKEAAPAPLAPEKEKEASKPVSKPASKPVPKPAEQKPQSTQREEQRKPGGDGGASLAQPSTAAPSSRPDSRGNSNGNALQPGRVPHALPSRPDPVGPAMSRGGRVPDHRAPPEYHGHGRHDARNNSTADYSRLDRPGAEGTREPFSDRREPSPGHRHRARTPDRGPGPNSMDRREPWGSRDTRDYMPDDRSMRPPPRDARGPPGRAPGWGDPSRDPRDMRDMRDRPSDPRGPPLPHLDSRNRNMGPAAPLPAPENPQYRRESLDRSGLPPRPQMDSRPPINPPSLDRPPMASDRPLINPERAALIEGDRSRPDFRPDRRERGSRPQSPRRGDERAVAPPYPARNEPPREHRDDRGPDRAPYDRHPSHAFPAGRDRRDEATGTTPTGPRSGRNDFPEQPMQNRNSRDIFSTSHPPRPPVDPNHGRLSQDYSQASRSTQDPNYGRLNPPSDIIPSGPRGRNPPTRGGRNFTAPAHPHVAQVAPSANTNRPPPDPVSDRREHTRREPNHDQPPANLTPAAPEPVSQDKVGIHPSRLGQIQPAPIQTEVPAPPSGPRSRGQQGPGPSPSTRGPPSGPAAAGERGGRREDKSFARTINSVLSQGAPPPTGGTFDRTSSDRGASIRGRAARASGVVDPATAPSPIASHPGTPNAHVASQDDGRSDGRGHRDGRRTERSGRHRSRSPARADRKGDERATRNDEPEALASREFGPGREKRGGDREGGRRERNDRDRRERGPREDTRVSGRGDETAPRRGGPPVPEEATPWGHDGRLSDARMRGGPDRRDDRDRRAARDDGRENRDGRKRTRGGDEGPPHGEIKRPRRNGGN